MSFSSDRLLHILSGFPRPPRYWVAYSGGLDSSVLLHALAAVRGQLPAELRALHVDHGLQSGSDRWAAHCRARCRALQVPLLEQALGLSPPRGESPEAAAREARLAAFRGAIGADELVLTAQHRDDQAETLLLQLLRGSGPGGLAAMPRLAGLQPGWLGRPLLEFGRGELLDYARRQGLVWIDDPSNFDVGIDRNYLRHRVLPLLARRWPAYAETFSRSARHCAEAQGLIEGLAGRELESARGDRPGSLSVSALRALDPPLRRVLLRHWIGERGFRTPSAHRLERVVRELLTAAPDRNPLVAWRGAEVRRYRDGLFILEPLPGPPAGEGLVWQGGDTLTLPGDLGRLRLEPDVGCGIDPARWRDAEVRVRFRAGGERCRVAGQAHRKPLKKLFQEWGVPDWLRPLVPLLFLDGELVAVGGSWVCGQLRRGLGVVWEGHPWPGILADAAT